MSQNYQVYPIRAFNDNYIWLIKSVSTNHCVVVDPGEASEVIQHIMTNNLILEAVLITHHHQDHTGGVKSLLAHFGETLTVYGPSKEAKAVVTHPLKAGDVLSLQTFGTPCEILDIPGHTLGHIAYVTSRSLFCGDTLFSAGCGRMFEGTASQFYSSLNTLAQLPESTQVYPAHEYTLANLLFAQAVMPNKQLLNDKYQEVQQKLRQGEPSLPSDIATERLINPFLNTHNEAIQQAISEHFNGEQTDEPAQWFAYLRAWKDSF